MSASRRLLVASFIAFCFVVIIGQSRVLAICGDLSYNGGCDNGGFTLNWTGGNECGGGGSGDYGCAQAICSGACNSVVTALGYCYYNEYSSWFWFTCGNRND